MVKPAAKWLYDNYGPNAVAVAGSFVRTFASGTRDAETVMEALRQFSCIYDTTATRGKDGHIDPVQMAIHEGRRQMYLHIVQLLEVTERDLQLKEKDPDVRSAAERGPDRGYRPEPRYPNSGPHVDGPASTGGGPDDTAES